MTLIRASTAPIFELPGLRVTGLASPSRGATTTCAWRLTIAPGTLGTPHTVTREEIFVALAGTATATIAGIDHLLGAGDALIVPAGVEFTLANPGALPFVAIAVIPVGGQAAMPDGEPFSPPWTV
jgi:mannose-6-phosphate isomerase-like protein (cupin superfamily)